MFYGPLSEGVSPCLPGSKSDRSAPLSLDSDRHHLTLLVLASIDSPLAGIGYILLFGLGSVLSMGVMTVLISLPIVFSANRLPNLNSFIQPGVGVLSILFGVFLMYKIGFTEGLF